MPKTDLASTNLNEVYKAKRLAGRVEMAEIRRSIEASIAFERRQGRSPLNRLGQVLAK